MEIAVKTNQELGVEINALHSTLKEAVDHLKRVDDRLRREMRMIGKVATYATQINGELISNVTDFSSLISKQFQQLRVVIETTKALSFLVSDYSNCLKGGI